MTAVRGTFADIKNVKTRGVSQLIIEIPVAEIDHALDVLGGWPQSGQEQWVGIAPLKAPKKPADEQPPSEPTPAPQEPERLKSEADKQLIKQAGLLPTKEAFQSFLFRDRFYRDLWDRYRGNPEMNDQQIAEQVVRDYCEVESRADIRAGQTSGQRMGDIIRAYRADQEGRTDEAYREMAR